MVPDIKFIPSPNHSSRGGVDVRMVVLHYTAGGGGAVSWFQNPTARASSHFVVTRNGKIVQMVDLERSAWHAGQRGRRAVDIKPNRSSVGIEIVNWGLLSRGRGGFRTYTGALVPPDEVVKSAGRYWQRYAETQLAAVVDLVAWLCDSLGIPRRFMFEGQPGFIRRGTLYDEVPYYLPAGRVGANSRLASWRFKDNAGICGHCHIAAGKDDPGPHLPWERIVCRKK